VSYDAAMAMLAGRCQRLNGAFEAVKKVRLSIFNNFEALVVLVSTSLTCLHDLVLVEVRDLKTAELKRNCDASSTIGDEIFSQKCHSDEERADGHCDTQARECK